MKGGVSLEWPLDEEMKWIDWAQGEEEGIKYLQKTWNSSLVIFVYPALDSNFLKVSIFLLDF